LFPSSGERSKAILSTSVTTVLSWFKNTKLRHHLLFPSSGEKNKAILNRYVTTGKLLPMDPAEYVCHYHLTMEAEIAPETLRYATKARRHSLPNMHVTSTTYLEHKVNIHPMLAIRFFTSLTF
jgi:hypothetical protein